MNLWASCNTAPRMAGAATQDHNLGRSRATAPRINAAQSSAVESMPTARADEGRGGPRTRRTPGARATERILRHVAGVEDAVPEENWHGAQQCAGTASHGYTAPVP